MPLSQSAEAQRHLATLIVQCFAALKVFGKEPEHIRDTIALFQRVLAPYSLRQVSAAFDEYVSRNSDMPSPADIVNIIDPPNKELSAAVYVSLQKKAYSGDYLDREERAYCEAFRRQEYAKVRGGSSALQEAEQEISQFKITYDRGYPEGSDYE